MKKNNIGIVNLGDFIFDENGKCRLKPSSVLDIRKLTQARHINKYGLDSVRTSCNVNGITTPISVIIERTMCKLAVCN